VKLSAPFYPDGLPWQEGIIIEPPWSRAVASKVSINLKGLTVPILLTTYILNIKIWVDGSNVEITGTIPVEDSEVVTTSS